MLVFREQSRPCDPQADLQDLIRDVERLELTGAAADDWLSALIDAGEIHAACVDAVCPSVDDLHPAATALGDLTEAIAAAWMDARGGRSTATTARRVQRARQSIGELPARVVRSVPEGFAYYALYPETYEAAARDAIVRAAARDVIVIGIRSIGTTLGAVVTEAARRAGARAWGWTIRPRGHPFDRTVQIGPALAARLTARHGALFLVVDEGPGLSGTSFAAAADAVRSFGVSSDRVVLLPSYEPDLTALRTERGRDAFRRHVIVTASFETHVLAGGLHGHRRDALQDLSAGRWREHVRDARRAVPVQPHHERRKYLADEDHAPTLITFEGLGPYGRRALARALTLAESGFVPAPGGFHRGFLSRRWLAPTAPLPGRPELATIGRIGSYVGWVARRFATGDASETDPLAEMLLTNAGEALGDGARMAAGRLADHARTMRGPAVQLDGRMQWHEWLASGDSLVKVDALHHHDDHFFPGPSDAAWDLAGAIVELALDTGEARALIDAYEAATGDRGVVARLPFFSAAYAAFRVGYAAMASESLAGTEDGRRFASVRRRYERASAERS